MLRSSVNPSFSRWREQNNLVDSSDLRTLKSLFGMILPLVYFIITPLIFVLCKIAPKILNRFCSAAGKSHYLTDKKIFLQVNLFPTMGLFMTTTKCWCGGTSAGPVTFISFSPPPLVDSFPDSCLAGLLLRRARPGQLSAAVSQGTALVQLQPNVCEAFYPTANCDYTHTAQNLPTFLPITGEHVYKLSCSFFVKNVYGL